MTYGQPMTFAEVRAELWRMAKEAGGQKALAEKLGVHPMTINYALHSRRRAEDIGPKLLKAMGLRKVTTVTYERIKKKGRA